MFYTILYICKILDFNFLKMIHFDTNVFFVLVPVLRRPTFLNIKDNKCSLFVVIARYKIAILKICNSVLFLSFICEFYFRVNMRRYENIYQVFIFLQV